MEARIRRLLSKPLAKRKVSPGSESAFKDALSKLESLALAHRLTPFASEHLKQMKGTKGKGAWKDAEHAVAMVDLSFTLLKARKISYQEHVFNVSYVASGVHEERLFKREYPDVENISQKMKVIEEAHGAYDGWPIGEGPRQYRRLNKQWELLLDKHFVATLKIVGAEDVADLYLSSTKKFELIRERGRRAVFPPEGVAASISDVVVRYESEATSAASVGAYTASVILLGAAVEGLLLLRCLRSKKKAISVAENFPKKDRPSQLDDLLRWTFDQLIEVCLAAGWLPVIEEIGVRPDGLAHVLRDMRNCIHPGRVARTRPWIEMEKEDYEQAEVIYRTIFATTSKSKTPMSRALE